MKKTKLNGKQVIKMSNHDFSYDIKNIKSMNQYLESVKNHFNIYEISTFSSSSLINYLNLLNDYSEKNKNDEIKMNYWILPNSQNTTLNEKFVLLMTTLEIDTLKTISSEIIDADIKIYSMNIVNKSGSKFF